MRNSNHAIVLGWVAVCIGAILLITSFFIPETRPHITAIFLGLGVALFPAGLFIIISDFNYSMRVKSQIENALHSSTLSLTGSIEGLKDAIDFLNKAKDLGIVMGYRNREEGLNNFLHHLANYVNNPGISNKKVVFVGSSLKGVLETKDFGERISKIMSDSFAAENKTEFDFLLTHPAYSRYREIQEDRAEGDIAKEILHAMAWLEHHNIPREHIKVYKGTPTCFLMASSEKMLINPYPYELEAYKCFCFEVVNNESSDSIYKSYFENHYNKPWMGQEHNRDHYKQPSALSYFHDYFDGPICSDANGRRCSEVPIGDVFFIDDKGSFYIAVNISALEKQIAYIDDKGVTRVINVGDIISIGFLLRETEQWECVGELKLGDDRRGFWHKTFSNRAMSAYKHIGLLDRNNPNPLGLNLTGKDGEGLLLWKEVPLEIK